MNTIKIDKKNTKMIAHQGLSGIEPGNTNVAFIAAGNRSYYGIETDIRKIGDGQFAVIHDTTTTRATGGLVNVDVQMNTYDLLKEIVLPDKDGSVCRQDIRIPLLRDYIRTCKKYEKVGVLEIKDSLGKEDLKSLVQLIEQENYLEHIIFIAFDLNNCIILRELLPKQRIQWLTRDDMTEEMKENLYRYKLDLDIFYEKVTKQLVEELHSNHIEVNCWTCDDVIKAENLVEMGVDYITSNILE